MQTLERVAYLPHGKQLYSPMTVEELVRFNRGFFPRWSNELAAHTAKALDIPMRNTFGELSIGNQTKVALLLALAQDADVLILDEPTSGLHPLMVGELLRLLIEDHVGQGRTIFLSSHQLAEVEQICEWVGILEQGRLLLESRLEDIRNDFRLVTASDVAEELLWEPSGRNVCHAWKDHFSLGSGSIERAIILAIVFPLLTQYLLRHAGL